MGEHSEFYDKIFDRLQADHSLRLQDLLESSSRPEKHLSKHPDALINPSNSSDAPEFPLEHHATHDAVVEQKRQRIAKEEIKPIVPEIGEVPLHDMALDEEMRMETVLDMLHSPRQKAWMEKMVPFEMLQARYPEVYK